MAARAFTDQELTELFKPMYRKAVAAVERVPGSQCLTQQFKGELIAAVITAFAAHIGDPRGAAAAAVRESS